MMINTVNGLCDEAAAIASVLGGSAPIKCSINGRYLGVKGFRMRDDHVIIDLDDEFDLEEIEEEEDKPLMIFEKSKDENLIQLDMSQVQNKEAEYMVQISDFIGDILPKNAEYLVLFRIPGSDCDISTIGNVPNPIIAIDLLAQGIRSTTDIVQNFRDTDFMDDTDIYPFPDDEDDDYLEE